MDEFIYKSLECQQIIKLFHWNTKVYSEHIASDSIYSKLVEKIDKFVEVYLGLEGQRMTSQQFKTTLSIKSMVDIRRYMHGYKSFFLNLNLVSELSNIRDEILSDIDQFLYLLTLK